MSQKSLRIGITLGDPCGIGPEITLAALSRGQPSGCSEAILFGDRAILERAAHVTGATLPSWACLQEVTHLAASDAPFGHPTALSGAAQVQYLEAAVRAARAREIDALATAPLSKASAMAAGFAFPGHTEYLAAAFDVPRVVMLLAGPRLRVALVTTHLALAKVSESLSPEGISETIQMVARGLAADFGLPRARIAVAALNPHAGEQARFGDEEARTIEPGIAAAARSLAEAGSGAQVSGPHVPDAVFRRALHGEFDAVVCMYHDQGLIPVKLLDFDDTVNITLGLPLPRTSPDHGVAYDLAGTGRARPDSMVRAVALAVEFAIGRAKQMVI